MTATEQLRHEHEAITLVLSILDRFCQRLGTGQDVNLEHFDQVLEFIQVFADKCHHGKEEQFLFPALETAGIPKTGGPLGVMLSEHEHGRALIQQLAASWQKYKSGDRAASAELITSARNYITLLNAHIFKENNVLFPMAEARLSADTQRKLLEEFDRLEVERIGAGRHAQFHKTLDFLRQTYLA
ncbi:MAG: hemerythrin domain-containing protein [Candidatus Binataceae bacterium]